MAFAQFMTVHAGMTAEEALRQFNPGLFQANEKNRKIFFHDYMTGNVQSESRFAHAWTSGQDNQLGILQAGSLVIQIDKPCGDPTYGKLVSLLAGVNPVVGFFDRLGDGKRL